MDAITEIQKNIDKINAEFEHSPIAFFYKKIGKSHALKKQFKNTNDWELTYFATKDLAKFRLLVEVFFKGVCAGKTATK